MWGGEWVYLCVQASGVDVFRWFLYVFLNIRMTQRWETMCAGLIEKERDRCSLWIVCVILRETGGLCCWMMRLDWSLDLDSYRRYLTSWLLFSHPHKHTVTHTNKWCRWLRGVMQRAECVCGCFWWQKGAMAFTHHQTHTHWLFLYLSVTVRLCRLLLFLVGQGLVTNPSTWVSLVLFLF